MKTRRRSAPAARRAGAARPAGEVRRAGSAGAVLEWACLLSPLAAAAAMAWSLRGAPLGTPVADDFEFIARVALHRRLDFFDSMGATYYWRPLSRQVWFSLVTPLLQAAPAVVAAIHVAILGGIAFLLARLARTVVSRPAAALVGAAVFACEPARALITWPSGIQHLLAGLLLSLTAHEVRAGRRWTAAPAALGAALSHELGALALVIVGAGGWLRGARIRTAWADGALGVALAAGYALGYRSALAHGVQLPEGAPSRAAGEWLEVSSRGLVAAFNAEPHTGLAHQLVVVLGGLGFAIALVALFRSERDTARRGTASLLAAAITIAGLGLLPLGALLPDWNAWRAFVPVLALVFATALACARARVAIGLAIVLLRVAALAGAPAAGPVTGELVPDASELSFRRLARIQRTLAATAPIVRDARLPAGARVGHWSLPPMTSLGFRGSLAVQLWAGDSSVRFVQFEGRPSIADPPALVLSYDTRPGRALALRLTPDALRFLRLAMEATDRGLEPEAREYYLAGMAAQVPESPALSAQMLHNLAIQEVRAGRLAAADSLELEAVRVRGVTPDAYAIQALIAFARGDRQLAANRLASCFRLEPGSGLGRYVAGEIQAAASVPAGSEALRPR